MTLIRKAAFSAAAMLLTTATSFAAEHDGFYTVGYRELSINLTQFDGFGELQIETNGFGSMSYGQCVLNFTRDESGAIKDMAPVATVNSAKCPEKINFSIAPAQKGMYQISFTDSGDLSGETFDLFPTLVQMQDAFRLTVPQGYDILGLRPGQSRAEIEAALQDKGFSKNEDWSHSETYNIGHKRALDVWQKGVSDFSEDTPEDAINITYNAVTAGEPEVALLIGRRWHIPQAANLSLTTLKKSLDDKHGATNGVFEARYYSHAGELQPKAFQPVCNEEIHLQAVNIPTRSIGQAGTVQVSPACGVEVNVMTTQSFEVQGAASQLNVTIAANDLAYEDFLKIWTLEQVKELEARYSLQANVTGAAPEL